MNTFGDLVCSRREIGFEQYAILVDGEKTDRAFYVDTSWETLEELADGYIYSSFEIVKLESRGLRMEARRMRALRRTLQRLGDDLIAYRERVSVSAPELLESSLPGESS